MIANVFEFERICIWRWEYVDLVTPVDSFAKESMLCKVLFGIFMTETRTAKIETMSRIGAISEKRIKICN